MLQAMDLRYMVEDNVEIYIQIRSKHDTTRWGTPTLLKELNQEIARSPAVTGKLDTSGVQESPRVSL